MQFFFGRRAMERRRKRGRPRGPKGVGPRGQVQGPRGTHETGPRALPRLGLFMYAFVFPKRDALISPELSEAMAELLLLSEGGQILLLRSSVEGEIIAIVITSPPWRGRRPLHQRHHQDHHHLLHHLHHHLRYPLRSPHSLRVAIP